MDNIVLREIIKYKSGWVECILPPPCKFKGRKCKECQYNKYLKTDFKDMICNAIDNLNIVKDN